MTARAVANVCMGKGSVHLDWHRGVYVVKYIERARPTVTLETLRSSADPPPEEDVRILHDTVLRQVCDGTYTKLLAAAKGARGPI